MINARILIAAWWDRKKEVRADIGGIKFFLQAEALVEALKVK